MSLQSLESLKKKEAEKEEGVNWACHNYRGYWGKEEEKSIMFLGGVIKSSWCFLFSSGFQFSDSSWSHMYLNAWSYTCVLPCNEGACAHRYNRERQQQFRILFFQLSHFKKTENIFKNWNSVAIEQHLPILKHQVKAELWWFLFPFTLDTSYLNHTVCLCDLLISFSIVSSRLLYDEALQTLLL